MEVHILPHVHGCMIFMDDNMDEKMMNFILNIGNKRYFCKKLNERNKTWKQFMLVSFKRNVTHEMFKSHFKVIFHISLI